MGSLAGGVAEVYYWDVALSVGRIENIYQGWDYSYPVSFSGVSRRRWFATPCATRTRRLGRCLHARLVIEDNFFLTCSGCLRLRPMRP